MPTIQRGDAQLHYYLDDFTDPWRSAPEAIVLQHGFSRNGRFWYNWPPLAQPRVPCDTTRFARHGPVDH